MSYYGSSGSSGSSGGYSSYYTPSYHTSPGYEYEPGELYESGEPVPYGTPVPDVTPQGDTPVYEDPAAEPSAGSITLPPLATSQNENKVHIQMSVPEQANVFLNGQQMTSTGMVRNFISPELPGQGPYYYQIRIELPAKGENLVVEHKQRVVTGEEYELTFAEQDGTLVIVPQGTGAEFVSR
ncbi:MAG TPA: hypothetical protein DIW81_09825 [Planctomycetaceae bacterium]|nr:hypothetical protein [Rubinisphaera sp.]HCS51875.1 hypothetical protein [Planctomycetaceae bacterium]